MKIKHFIIGLLLIGFGFSAQVNAQYPHSAGGYASANIIHPISITKTVDMSFGNIATDEGSAGTVILTPTNSRTPSAGITLPANTGTVTSATFTVHGQAGYTYSITLPTESNAIHSTVSGAVDMTVTNFTCNYSSGVSILNGTGDDVIHVGATLNIAKDQVEAQYTSTDPFIVRINYN